MAGIGLYFSGVHGVELYCGGTKACVGGHSSDGSGRGDNGWCPRDDDVLRGEVEEDEVDEEAREACEKRVELVASLRVFEFGHR